MNHFDTLNTYVINLMADFYTEVAQRLEQAVARVEGKPLEEILAGQFTQPLNGGMVVHNGAKVYFWAGKPVLYVQMDVHLDRVSWLIMEL